MVCNTAVELADQYLEQGRNIDIFVVEDMEVTNGYVFEVYLSVGKHL